MAPLPPLPPPLPLGRFPHLRPIRRPLHPRPPAQQPRRQFLDFAGGVSSPSSQKFIAARRMSYPPRALYRLVADIDSYRLYLPYCLDSRVTARCPATNAPTEADLRIGWGSFDETFRSRVSCCGPAATPTAATAAVGGEVMTVQADACGGGGGGGSSSGAGLFQLLKARWEVSPATTTGDDSSQVRLHVEYLFVNPLYNAFSGAFAPKLTDLMVDAFEKRAREVLGDGKSS